MKNNNHNNQPNNNQQDNHNNEPTTNPQRTITNLANNYSNLSANGQDISWLIFESGKTPYKIARETGVPDGNLYLIKKGDRLIDNLSLSVASKLTTYAIKLQGQQDNRNNKDD